MTIIIQLQYSLADSRVFRDVKNITQSSLHPTQPNPTEPMDGPNPWPTLLQTELLKHQLNETSAIIKNTRQI